MQELGRPESSFQVRPRDYCLSDQPIVKGPSVINMINQAASAVTEVGLFRSECGQEVAPSRISVAQWLRLSHSTQKSLIAHPLFMASCVHTQGKESRNAHWLDLE